MYIAKLVKGKDYGLPGKLFLAGEEQEIDKKTYNYLKDNPQFEVKEVKEKTNASADTSKE